MDGFLSTKMGTQEIRCEERQRRANDKKKTTKTDQRTHTHTLPASEWFDGLNKDVFERLTILPNIFRRLQVSAKGGGLDRSQNSAEEEESV